MTNKRKEKTDDEITNKRQNKKTKTLPNDNTTLNNFFILKKIPTKDRVKKVWDSLKEEEKFLLNEEFKQMHEEWLYLLRNELKSPHYLNIKRKLIERERKSIVLPPKEHRFRYFRTSPNDISVIIVGQDPYPNDADGLAFSSKQIKPSLRKIFDLMEWDLKSKSWSRPKTGSLEKWSQDVLLLNSVLTVERGKSMSHTDLGWQKFTDTIIKMIGNKKGVVTILWGKYAKEKSNLVKKGYVIKSGHPSPLNTYDRSFDNSRCFSMANEYLKKNNKKEIDWSL